MKVIKLIAFTVLIAASNFALADKSSLNECIKYLQYSNDSFKALVSSSKEAAQKAVDTLTTCEAQSVCSKIKDNGSFCPRTLAARIFTSEYYANYNPKADDTYNVPSAPKATNQQQKQQPSSPASATTTQPAPTTNFNQKPTHHPKQSEDSSDNKPNIIVPRTDDSSKNNGTTEKDPPAKTHKQSSPSINWFN